ncbi:SpaH/EbpB family LPXTG-anchored major pilin [Specibacter sp. NPDC057265]|uniref:SpaH/EbpB family LPXTG-anchored major pilin n=1 Tax=Specibacter sp. NPDC057265 TaxID=3346075 RepID=UPI00362869EB
MVSQPPLPRTSRLRRLSITLGALVAGTALSLGAVAPASAAPNLEPSRTGSITVHKYQEPTTATGLANNGTAVDTTGLTAISGVTFTAQKVNIDLSVTTNWQNLESYTVAQAQANLTGTPKALTTDDAGVAKFENLSLGLYLLTETDIGSNKIAFKGQPFLVTMPLALNNDWVYDVHTYPKNTVTSLNQVIDDSAAHVIGDPVKSTFTSQVPSLPAGTALTSFGMADTLDPRLSYVSADVTVAGVDLVKGVDYTIVVKGQEVLVEFTPAGLAKLQGKAGAAVTVTVNTTINALGDGQITNKGQVFINGNTNRFDSNVVTTSWGALKVTKHAKGDVTKVLSGAEFQLFALDGQGKRIGGELHDVTGAAADVTFTTAADGTFTVTGLKAGNYELVETKAPVGYKLDSTPKTVTVTQGTVENAAAYSIANTQVPAFQLPLTGSTGTTLFSGIGLLLIVAGGSIAVARKRRTAKA